MVALIWLGALLVILGLIHMAYVTLWSRRLSDPPRSQHGTDDTTLEPPRQGLRFLGFGRNWLGALLFVLGLLLLLWGAAF
ncbi:MULTISPECIES: hypothetical protein [Phyllobacteriaceae]|uniref:hypothetical protein n=1 Tax=Phyllobacteriaceae TaxID=69277 RepID=UPI002ACAEAB6|nr:hypothetical protein [Chelativorans sp. M5D2P16]MDZ5699015.1 hypothetical protein [Chelativorans sp. M5D2P16]